MVSYEQFSYDTTRHFNFYETCECIFLIYYSNSTCAIRSNFEHSSFCDFFLKLIAITFRWKLYANFFDFKNVSLR